MTEPKSVELTLHPDTTAQLLIGGHDLSRSARDVQVRAGSRGELPTVVVELDVIEGLVTGPVLAELDEGSQQALIAMGWRPPE